MKKFITSVCIILASIFFIGAIGVRIWGREYISKNIRIAQSRYPGKAEDALISFLLDTTNTPGERSTIAIWTLGQIKSEKAKPILWSLYKNDPEGKTCRGRHNEVLCQYELYKALYAEKVNWLPLYPALNK
jgi:hypothetical protein